MANSTPIQLKVTDSLAVTVIPNQAHEFVMTTEQVAAGYGISTATITSHKRNHKAELMEDIHFFSRIENFNSALNAAPKGATKRTYWTKAGVIRLGMFIMSERAKQFRDWIEQVVLNVVTEVKSPKVQLPEADKRKHNRLNQDRVTDILRDLMEVEDKDLRIRLMNKILNN